MVNEQTIDDSQEFSRVQAESLPPGLYLSDRKAEPGIREAYDPCRDQMAKVEFTGRILMRVCGFIGMPLGVAAAWIRRDCRTVVECEEVTA
jgi:hypothetical protein